MLDPSEAIRAWIPSGRSRSLTGSFNALFFGSLDGVNPKCHTLIQTAARWRHRGFLRRGSV